MMACGLPVVDLDFNESMTSYDGYNTALLVEPSPRAICDGILKLLKDPEESKQRRIRGRLLVSQMPTEDETGKYAVDTYVEKLMHS